MNIGIDTHQLDMNDPVWREANCKGKDTNLFFPDNIADAKEAIGICQDCPIKALCLDWAIEHDVVGIWGGYPIDFNIAGLYGDQLNRALGYCARGHIFDGVTVMNGSVRRTCSRCKADPSAPFVSAGPSQRDLRNRRIRALLDAGLSNREIADQLALSIEAVERRRAKERKSA